MSAVTRNALGACIVSNDCLGNGRLIYQALMLIFRWRTGKESFPRALTGERLAMGTYR